jgi:hypothetical protein
VHLTDVMDTKSSRAARCALVVCDGCTWPVNGRVARDVVRRDVHPMQDEPRPPTDPAPTEPSGTPVVAAPTGCLAATRLTG